MNSKKRILCISHVLLIVTLMTSVVFAVEYPNKSVAIYPNQISVNSGLVRGTWKYIAVTNSDSSIRNLAGSANYYDYTLRRFVMDPCTYIVAQPGTIKDNIMSTVLSSSTYWYVNIHSTGNGGCNGIGWIWLDQ